MVWLMDCLAVVTAVPDTDHATEAEFTDIWFAQGNPMPFPANEEDISSTHGDILREQLRSNIKKEQ